MSAIGEIRIGTSGRRYPLWRKEFYPAGLAQQRELECLSRRLDAVEIDGSFYSLQRSERHRAWFDETPPDFVFAVKGGRFSTHLKQLRDVETVLANFHASGVLGLGAKVDLLPWQLPPRPAFDPDRVASFFTLLPLTAGDAAKLGARHDTKLKADLHLESGTLGPPDQPGQPDPPGHPASPAHPVSPTSPTSPASPAPSADPASPVSSARRLPATPAGWPKSSAQRPHHRTTGPTRPQ